MLPLLMAAGMMWAAGIIPTLLITMISKVDRAKRSYDEYIESEGFFKEFVESDAYKAAKKQQRESAAALTEDQRNVLSAAIRRLERRLYEA
jgi:predicted DNA binding protein